jgi:hypothetical protein
MDEIIQSLNELENQIKQGSIGRSRPWGGADVVIGPPPSPIQTENSFYPDSRYVATVHFAELSWLFEQLRDRFTKGIDGANKSEFYGRLANMANRFTTRNGDQENSMPLLLAVMHQAFSIAEEIDECGYLDYLPIAPGNLIKDDLINEFEQEEVLTAEETRKALREFGIEI